MDKLDFVSYVAIIIIVISLLNVGVEFTGMAHNELQDNATVNVTIDSTTSINFTTDFIDFGSGVVTVGESSATLDSNASGNPTNGNWTQPGTSFTLENIGNQNASIDLYSWKSAAAFIGGTSPAYKYAVSDNQAGSCNNDTTALNTWTAFTQATGDTICNPLYALDANDAIDVDIQLTIPSDSTSGEQTDTITAEATAV